MEGDGALDRNLGPGYNTLLLWFYDLYSDVPIDSATHYLAF